MKKEEEKNMQATIFLHLKLKLLQSSTFLINEFADTRKIYEFTGPLTA